VYYALNHRITPQRKARGWNPILDTPKRKQLIEWISQNKITRRTQWIAIPSELGWNCGEEAIAKALNREGYGRFLARRKPVLDDQLKALRLRWAYEHINWTNEQWDNVL